MKICIIISIVLLYGCTARATLAGGRLHPDLEQAVHVRKGQGVSQHVRASSNVTLPNFRQCLRLCWYISACADVSYDSVTKACRLFSTSDHSAALSAVKDSYGQTFASVLTADMSRVPSTECLGRPCNNDSTCVSALSASGPTLACAAHVGDLASLMSSPSMLSKGNQPLVPTGPSTQPATTESETTPAPTTLSPTKPAPTTLSPTKPASTTLSPTKPALTTESPTKPAPTTLSPTKPALTTESPTKPAPTTESPTKPAPTTLSPTKPALTTESPTKPAPTTLSPTKPALTTESPTKPAPTTESPTKPTPTTLSPTKPALTTESPTKPAPTTESPTKPAPTTESPTKPAPTTLSPTKPTPTTEAPTKPTPTTEAPTKPAPTTEAPTLAPTTGILTTAGSNASPCDPAKVFLANATTTLYTSVTGGFNCDSGFTLFPSTAHGVFYCNDWSHPTHWVYDAQCMQYVFRNFDAPFSADVYKPATTNNRWGVCFTAVVPTNGTGFSIELFGPEVLLPDNSTHRPSILMMEVFISFYGAVQEVWLTTSTMDQVQAVSNGTGFVSNNTSGTSINSGSITTSTHSEMVTGKPFVFLPDEQFELDFWVDTASDIKVGVRTSNLTMDDYAYFPTLYSTLEIEEVSMNSDLHVHDLEIGCK